MFLLFHNLSLIHLPFPRHEKSLSIFDSVSLVGMIVVFFQHLNIYLATEMYSMLFSVENRGVVNIRYTYIYFHCYSLKREMFLEVLKV